MFDGTELKIIVRDGSYCINCADVFTMYLSLDVDNSGKDRGFFVILPQEIKNRVRVFRKIVGFRPDGYTIEVINAWKEHTYYADGPEWLEDELNMILSGIEFEKMVSMSALKVLYHLVSCGKICNFVGLPLCEVALTKFCQHHHIVCGQKDFKFAYFDLSSEEIWTLMYCFPKKEESKV